MTTRATLAMQLMGVLIGGVAGAVGAAAFLTWGGVPEGALYYILPIPALVFSVAGYIGASLWCYREGVQ